MSSPFAARTADKESGPDLTIRGIVPICWGRRSIDFGRGLANQ